MLVGMAALDSDEYCVMNDFPGIVYFNACFSVWDTACNVDRYRVGKMYIRNPISHLEWELSTELQVACWLNGDSPPRYEFFF